MSSESGWLKKSLDDAEHSVSNWPEWKRSLESAINQTHPSTSAPRSRQLNHAQNTNPRPAE
jgi:hypothetical protein